MIPINLQGNFQDLTKKIFWISFFVLLLFAGFIVMTQEADDLKPDQKNELFENEEISEEDADEGEGEYIEETQEPQMAREIPEWVKPTRWFRSNSGGMAVEEIPSRLAALRNKYALVIDFVEPEELPEYLLEHYNDSFFIEIRTLYENGKESRKQWIFRDAGGQTRLVAVFIEPEEEPEENESVDIENVNIENITEQTDDNIDDIIDDNIDVNIAAEDEEFTENIGIDDIDFEEGEELVEIEKKIDVKTDSRSGFIEIMDENNLLTSEYKYYSDGIKNKTEYYYNGRNAVRAVSLSWEENDEGGEYRETHRDYFYYNRSSFLRAVERVFSTEQNISDSIKPVRISFSGNILNAAKNDFFMGEKLNAYPEFFGDLLVKEDSRIVFTTDERGRILTQTLYENKGKNEEDPVIWVIESKWSGDSIVSVKKTEGDIVLLSEYEYDSSGKIVLERNLRNGALERIVRTEGKRDIEELYMNNKFVMQAVWEDGRKISESRIKSN